MQEFRPAGVDQAVGDHRLDRLAAAGDALDGSVGFAPPASRIDHDQFAHPRHAVVAADDADDLGRVSRNGPGVEHAVGPVRVAAVVFHLPRAVRVHVEHQAREVVGAVGVLPPRIQDAAVVHDRRAPVVVLLERQHSSLAGRRVEQGEVGHVCAAADARHALQIGGRGEDDPAVRQVAGVVVVHVGFRAGRDASQAGAVGVQFVDLPRALGGRHREQHPAGVEMQIDVADEHASVRLEQRRQRAVRPQRRERHDLVVKAGLRQGAVALPVLRQAHGRDRDLPFSSAWPASPLALRENAFSRRRGGFGRSRRPRQVLDGRRILGR